MKRLVPISVFVLAALLLSISPLAANAQAGPTTIYVVQPGDTAFSIASRHCMTVQELQNLNGAVITNPNMLYPGMQLRVVNRCGGGHDGGWNCGGWGVVFDRGPSPHASGVVFGNTYIVAAGDTAFSIAQRFGITTDALARANGINPWRIWAGQRLIIPGLGGGKPCPAPPCNPCPPTPCNPGGWPPANPCPTITPSITAIPVSPTPTATPTQQRIQITNPTQSNTPLPSPFTVTGTAQGLPVGTLITVQAIAYGNNGFVVPQITTLQPGPSAGQTSFSASLTVPVTVQTMGFVVAFPTQLGMPSTSVQVVFSPGGAGGVTYNNFSGSQCVVAPIAGAPFYSTVGATQPAGYFPGAAAAQGLVVGTAAVQGAKLNNQYWFQIDRAAGTTGLVWAPQSSVQVLSSVCTGW